LSSKPGQALGALARLYLDVALWRRGPADVPAVPLLLWFTVAAYAGVTAGLSAALGLRGAWPQQLAADVAFNLAWVWLLLWATRRPERFLQTAIAVFAVQLVLAPLMVGVVALAPQPETAVDGGQALAVIANLAVSLWIVYATARIMRPAFEWPLAACVPLSFFLFLAEQLLLQALFEPGH